MSGDVAGAAMGQQGTAEQSSGQRSSGQQDTVAAAAGPEGDEGAHLDVGGEDLDLVEVAARVVDGPAAADGAPGANTSVRLLGPVLCAGPIGWTGTE